MMQLSTLDYIVIIAFFILILTVGIVVSKTSGKNTSEFFLSGKNMPWWLLGMSMVATTFSTDTPNLVTDLVRQKGVSGNWVWWAFLITGMLTVFIYAKLWRKSNVNTDMEFYALRYGGKPAAFLRGFRAVYLGLCFNILSIAAVCLAAIKIGGIMLGLSPLQTIGIAAIVTVIFSMIGGFKGVIYTDFILFFVAMAGALGAAYVSVNHDAVGGLSNLLENKIIQEKINLLPDFKDTETLVTLFIIPLAVQWWSTWYPGAEPGGGGYIAQRMLAAKDENHAIGATFFFNIMHYALRPWPWILVALASLVVFPDLASIQRAFPDIAADKLGHDLAYPAMLTFLPSGILGIVLASLIAAFMSTISTHLNWGASYLVHDFYKPYLLNSKIDTLITKVFFSSNKKQVQEKTEKKLVFIARGITFILMLLGAFIALQLQNAAQIFDIILMFGAGTGLIFILRWFWWRINAWSEIVAMFFSGMLSIVLTFTNLGVFLFGNDTATGIFASWAKFPLVVGVTTLVWIITTFITPAEKDRVLFAFYAKTTPGGPGWRKIIEKAKKQNHPLVKENTTWNVPLGIIAVVLGCVLVYACLFATGNWIYANHRLAIILSIIAISSAFLLQKVWRRLKNK